MEGYGPDNPPPTKDGIGPDPNAYEAPPEDNTPELTPRDFHEVPLDAEDRCIAEKHADRVREGFGGKGTTSAAVLRGTLMKLGHPESRIHAMPAQGGSPRVRLDLRIDSRAALEIVGTSSTLIIQPLGAVGGSREPEDHGRQAVAGSTPRHPDRATSLAAERCAVGQRPGPLRGPIVIRRVK